MVMIQIGIEPFHGVYNEETEQFDAGADGVMDDAKWLELMISFRNNFLAKSDWTQGVDSPLTDEKKAEWVTYRQKLRDLPTTATLGMIVEFPDPPS
tara:strand:- start:136 stop:423 length:288 start_codon:yes stop_codon:yes gene_type:complete